MRGPIPPPLDKDAQTQYPCFALQGAAKHPSVRSLGNKSHILRSIYDRSFWTGSGLNSTREDISDEHMTWEVIADARQLIKFIAFVSVADRAALIQRLDFSSAMDFEEKRRDSEEGE